MVVRANSVMTRGVVTVRPDSPLEDARRLLTSNRFSALPVVDRGYRLVGILSTLDLLRAEVEGRADALVAEFMTREPLTVGPDMAVSIVAHRLEHYGQRRVVPVVERGLLVGIITRGDLLRPTERRSFLGRLLPAEDDDLDVLPNDGTRFGTTAGEVMTPLADLIVADTATRVDQAAAALSANRLTALPVLDDDDRLVGIVTEADLVADRLSGRRGPAPLRVGDAMTARATAVRHDVSIAKAARVMIEERRRVLPVIGADDRLVGMVSRGDLLRADSPPPQ